MESQREPFRVELGSEMTARIPLRLRFELMTWHRGAWVGACAVVVGLTSAVTAGVLWPLERDVRHLTAALDAAVSRGAITAEAPAPPRPGEPHSGAHASKLAVASPRSQVLRQIEGIRRDVSAQWPWASATFTYHEKDAAGLGRVEVTVQSKARYPALRRALLGLLARYPNVSIDRIRLQANTQPDTGLNAQVTFTIWVATTQAKAPSVAQPMEQGAVR